MSDVPRFLLLEDLESDAELMERELRKANMEFVSRRVETKQDFLAALAEFVPDLVLSDYTLPQFDAVEALSSMREHGYNLPFILVTGSQTEEVAVQCMKEGATDYILKHNLMRLPLAVQNALGRRDSERARTKALEALLESEEQLRQSQKMEAIGRLAGGVAHDFNNLLTAILGQSELLLRAMPGDDPQRHRVEVIKRAGESAAALTRQLLAFSRKQVMQPKVLDLNRVVTETDRMLRRLIGEDVQLRTLMEPALGNIKADPGQIEQVLMNLAVNARDAMAGGGKLTIETKNIELDENYAGHHIAVKPGAYVMLAVSDTGIGMDEATLSRIFEPFFTTKAPGKGTGLGLSTVYGIVKQSGGNIWVYSERGQGTTFKIYLPRVGDSAEEYALNARAVTVMRGTETILLVEDEAIVRQLAREVLEVHGYRVLEAASGEAALAHCQRYAGTIDLLLTDVVMPETSGPVLARQLAALSCPMRILYMSGYTDDAIVHHGVLDKGTNFIQKPFSPNALMKKVRDVLDAPEQPSPPCTP